MVIEERKTENGQRIDHGYLVRFSLQHCVFIPHTINSTVSRQRVMQHIRRKDGNTGSNDCYVRLRTDDESLGRVSLQQSRGSASCNPWQGLASNDLAAARHATYSAEGRQYRQQRLLCQITDRRRIPGKG